MLAFFFHSPIPMLFNEFLLRLRRGFRNRNRGIATPKSGKNPARVNVGGSVCVRVYVYAFARSEGNLGNREYGITKLSFNIALETERRKLLRH